MTPSFFFLFLLSFEDIFEPGFSKSSSFRMPHCLRPNFSFASYISIKMDSIIHSIHDTLIFSYHPSKVFSRQMFRKFHHSESHTTFVQIFRSHIHRSVCQGPHCLHPNVSSAHPKMALITIRANLNFS